MSVCLTCKHRKECNRHWKDDIHAIGFTCYEEYRTNFERITESPEALAEFLAHDRMECHTAVCCSISCTGCTKEGVLKWLNEESIE